MTLSTTSTVASPDTRADTSSEEFAPVSAAHRSVLLVALGLVVALLVPLFIDTAAAQARTTAAQTRAERRIAAAVTNLLNAERHAHHLRALRTNAHLVSSARSHDAAMARRDDMSHQVRGESALGRRMERAGYHWTWDGENIGYATRLTTAAVLAVQRAMYNEHPPFDGHRQNILSTHFRHVGVDVYLDRAHRKVWLTVDFGNE